MHLSGDPTEIHHKVIVTGYFGRERRSTRSVLGRREGNACKDVIAVYVININLMNVKILISRSSKM